MPSGYGSVYWTPAGHPPRLARMNAAYVIVVAATVAANAYAAASLALALS